MPDLRGRFLRGVDGTARRDPDSSRREEAATGGNRGNLVGSIQGDSFEKHQHSTNSYSDVGLNNGSVRGTNNILTLPTDEVGGEETRPRNAYVHFIIKL